MWRETNLVNDIRLGERLWRHPAPRGAKSLEGLPQASGILGRGANPEIDVACRPWNPMPGYGVGTDDEVFNAFVG